MKLRRSRTNRIVAGILGGIADRYHWNANVLRVLWVLLTLTPFPGLIVYLVIWAVIPSDN